MYMRRPHKNQTILAAVLVPLAWLHAVVVPPCLAAAEKSESQMVPLLPLDEDLKLSGEKPPSLVVPERTISLQACFEEALQNNREIASARYNLPIANAAIQIAGAIPNPHFTLLYGWGPAWTLIIAGQPQQYGWQLDFQTAGKRTKQIAVARANYGVSEFTVAQVMFDVHNRVRRAYAEQAAAEAYEELIESQRKVALDLANISQKRFAAGKAPRSEELQAELGVLQLDIQRNQAQARLQQASAALSLITGELPKRVEVIDVDDNGLFKLSAEKTDIVPSPDRPLPPLQKLIPVAYSERPDLKVSVQQKFSDRRALTLARAQRIPDLFIDTGAQFTTFKKNQPLGLFNNPVTGVANSTPDVPGAYFNVTANVPILYQQQGEIAQAKATWLQDFDQIKLLRAQIAVDSIMAYESVNGARANIYKFQKELIPEAALVAKQAFRRYQVGKADLASAILARQQYQQILSSYFDTVVAYQNAWADLEKAIGVSLVL
jgi:outer membrane protein, heavy metal efflux system